MNKCTFSLWIIDTESGQKSLCLYFLRQQFGWWPLQAATESNHRQHTTTTAADKAQPNSHHGVNEPNDRHFFIFNTDEVSI